MYHPFRKRPEAGYGLPHAEHFINVNRSELLSRPVSC